MTEELLEQILGRSQSLFQKDLDGAAEEIGEKISATRILVIGAAGSIGGAFVKELLRFQPQTLHLVDPAENNLVELVRDLRSSNLQVPEDFKTLSIPMESASFERFFESEEEYDHVVNFAALKHVRVERDPYSLMRMLEVNVFALEAILRKLTFASKTKVFSVSSDKAVNPASLMGAGKAMMERLLYSYADVIPYTSARFANVAFSDGSLLHGFTRRFAKGQPLSAPTDVKRYFISARESGQLCLMACFLGGNREIFIPRLDPASDLKTFSGIAELYLRDRGFAPRIFDSESAAREFAAARKADSREWPCYFSSSDTSGEKPFEEFVGPGESADYSRYDALGVIIAPEPADASAMANGMAQLEDVRRSPDWTVADIAKAMGIVVPELAHRHTAKNLDDKM